MREEILFSRSFRGGRVNSEISLLDAYWIEEKRETLRERKEKREREKREEAPESQRRRGEGTLLATELSLVSNYPGAQFVAVPSAVRAR